MKHFVIDLHSPATLWPALLTAAALGLVACESPPTPPAAPAPTTAPAPSGTATRPGTVPGTAPVPPVVTPPAPTPAPPTAAAQQQAQRVAQGVVDLLEIGNEEQARSELQRALALDPGNRLALNLQRQMTEDPFVVLGRESFPYVVRAGDTLSLIAGRFLSDIYAFHILARYNNIKVPRKVGEGQTLRIPGKAPTATFNPPPGTERIPSARVPPDPPAPVPAAPAAEPSPAEPSPADKAYASADAAAKAGNDELALGGYRQAAGLGHPEAAVKAQATLKRLVDQRSRTARGALARQDLVGAIRGWDRVLEIDPNNETARLEREKARQLQEKVKKL